MRTDTHPAPRLRAPRPHASRAGQAVSAQGCHCAIPHGSPGPHLGPPPSTGAQTQPPKPDAAGGPGVPPQPGTHGDRQGTAHERAPAHHRAMPDKARASGILAVGDGNAGSETHEQGSSHGIS